MKSEPQPIAPIVHVVPYYPPHLGGMERVAAALAEQFASFTNVTVLTSRTDARHCAHKETRGALRIERLPSMEFAHTPVMPTLAWRLACQPKNSIVHLHIAQAFTPEVATLVAHARRQPLIAHFHLDVPPSGPLGALFVTYKRWVLGPVLRSAASVIVLTEDQAVQVSSLHRVPDRRIVIVPNAVDDAFFLPSRPTDVHEPLRLLAVGRLAQQKNIHRLLDAISMLTIPAEVVLVGDGDQRAQLERRANELRLRTVRFVGARHGEELLDWYRWADAFVLTSDSEGMPLTLLEAIAAQLPIIATDVAGVRATVGDAALLCAPTAGAVAESIEAFAGKPPLRDQLRAAAASIRPRLRWSDRIDQVENCYTRAMK